MPASLDLKLQLGFRPSAIPNSVRKEERENINFLISAKKWAKLHVLVEQSVLRLLVPSYPYGVQLGKAIYIK